MADQALDLVVFHEGCELTTVRDIADFDDSATIREHLLAVMNADRDEYERKIVDYSVHVHVHVHKAGHGMKEYTDRTRFRREVTAMAGHRRKAGKSMVPTRRARARRRLLWVRLQATTDPSQRIGIAAGYARAVLARLEPEQARRLANAAVSALVDATERLVTEQGAST